MRRPTRIIYPPLLLAVLLVAAPVASAQTPPAEVGPSLGPDRAGVSTRVGDRATGGGRDGGGGSDCLWRGSTLNDIGRLAGYLSPGADDIPPLSREEGGEPYGDDAPTGLLPADETHESGHYFTWFCAADSGLTWVDTGEPARLPEELRDIAYSELRPPQPDLNLAPAGNQVTQLPTWLWIDQATWNARPQVTASAGDGTPAIYQEATVYAEPISVHWNMGDGATTCTNPGTPYDGRQARHSPTCDYTYHHAANGYTVTATITWRIDWEANGVITIPRQQLGFLTTNGTTTTRVIEIQTIN